MSPSSPVAVETGSQARIAGRYRIEARLGEGGMAEVFRAVDESSGRRVALKRLTTGSSERMAAMFEREYRTLAGLRHPLIIEVYDYGVEAQGPYYTMELLAGQELREGGPLPWVEVCRCLCDVASALALLHARRLLHRDISPRNVWRTSNGRYKLLDFGALATFGSRNEVIGTPPCLAPEVLRGGELDQRTDLYALGALAYWLLTGSHAYKARELDQLIPLWRVPLQPPSERIVALRERGIERQPSPKALDELVLSMLSQDPLARPLNAVEVIDRLIPIAGLPVQDDQPIAQSYLVSNSFVAHEDELRQLHELIERACEGQGGAALIEGAAGLGKTRLLREIGVHAQLAGASVLHVDAALHRGFHGTLQALALQLLEELPEIALETARPHAPVLAHLSPELRARMAQVRAGPVALPSAPGEARLRVQEAMQAWLLAACARQPIVVSIDDLQDADDASAAWLAALGQDAASHPLFAVATLRTGDATSFTAPIQAFRDAASVVTLMPFTTEGTLRLVQSVFGEVACVGRLSEWLQSLTGGNPGECMELAHHLVKQNVIQYLDGSWLLPEELSFERLPRSVSEAQRARLDRLAPPARALGQLLSIHDRPLSLELCRALAKVDAVASDDVSAALHGLLREGVLATCPEGYLFTQQALRVVLLSELDGSRRRETHRSLGTALLAQSPGTAVQELEAGVHLLHGGEPTRAGALIARAGVRLTLSQTDSLRPAIPLLQEVERIYRAERRSERELIAVLTPLAVAGFHVDWRLSMRYADEALRVMQDALGLTVSRKLRRFLGRTLSLVVGLTWGATRWLLAARRDHLPTLSEAFTMLCTSVATLTGVDALCMDGERAARHTRVLEPLVALGRNHVAAVLFEFCELLGKILTDRMSETHAGLLRLIARLESSEPIAGLPPQSRIECLGGALYALGILESRRDGPAALHVAERLERLGMKVYEIAAHQVRTERANQQGDARAAARHRARVELYAMQRGTAWQAEIWGTTATLLVAVRTDNGPVIKQSAERLERRAEELPSFRRYAETARALHLLLRGKPDQAARVLEPMLDDEPLGLTGWAGALGCLARAYNQMGEHERARDVCRRVLAHASPTDLSFVALNQIVETELALAEAGLGANAEAAQRLDALIAQRTDARGPLTLGWLHEARARVALTARDLPSFRLHLQAAKGWFKPTEATALIAHCELLEKHGAQPAGSTAPWTRGGDEPLDADSSASSSDEAPTRPR